MISLLQSQHSLEQSIATLQTNVRFDSPSLAEHWLLYRSPKLPQPILHALTQRALQHFLVLPSVREFFPFWVLDALEGTRDWLAEEGELQQFQSMWKRALTHSAAEGLSMRDAYLTSELESCDCEDCPRCSRLESAHNNIHILHELMSEDETNSQYYEYGVEGITYTYQESVRTFRYSLQHQPLKLFLFLSELLTFFENNPLRPSTLLAWLFAHIFLMEERALYQSLRDELVSMLVVQKGELARQKAALFQEHEEALMLALFEADA